MSAAPALLGRGILVMTQDAVIEAQLGHLTPARLAGLLDFLSAQVTRLRATPGQDNALLRALGARMGGWLLSIHDPRVVTSRPLLLARLGQIAAAAEDLAALDDDNGLAIPALPGAAVLPFPLPRFAAAPAGVPL